MGLKISIVEDDEDVGFALFGLLLASDMEPRLYPDARTLLDATDGLDCDCILSDIQMPGMSGLELARKLRNSGFSGPILLMTAYPTATVAATAAELGCGELVVKPFDPDKLLKRIEREA